jgi:hypothetical protein
MGRIIALIYLQLLSFHLIGQVTKTYQPPVDFPMVLSGNFGELREDHFHSGIDIKTRGTIGHRVKSIDEGYVSRIKVQANGYGKSIYIDHPGGVTSVYGHLDRYREDLAAFVKEVQYKRRSHTVDIYLKPDQFRIGKGEIIAYSGNTGGSSGPHLHLEIRTTGDQHPTNVLKYGFDIADHAAPRFRTLSIEPADPESHINGKVAKQHFPLLLDGGIYTVPYGTRITGSGKLGVYVEVFDYLDGAGNRCGIYTLEMFLDGKRVYAHTMDEFSFSETRYINAHVDYEDLILENRKVHRLHRLPNDRLRIYDGLVDDGWVTIHDNITHELRVVAKDVAGNSATLEFKIKGDPEGLDKGSLEPVQGKFMKYNEKNHFESEGIIVDIPSLAFYQDHYFKFGKKPATSGSLSELYEIDSPGTAVHLPYTLSIRSSVMDPALQEKLLLVKLDEQGDWEAAGGEFAGGYVVASLSNFGTYAIAADTVSPEIIPLAFSPGGDMSGARSLRFTIRDDLSGIDKYQGYIDNKWALFEYDPKNDLLEYIFDKERITTGVTHELELYVTDLQGNANLFHATFTW